jgi:hypothetical protein
MAWRRDNASNPHEIAINLAFVSDSGGLRDKHPSRLDIPTPSCDRDDVSFTFRGGGDSLCDC